MNRVSLFHVGPPKTATTWVYACLREHPRVALPPHDYVYYFDMHHDLGEDWYHGHFSAAKNGDVLVDPTPSTICSPRAAERIAAYNPDAKILVTLRHPVERAFSHYWHLKKKGWYAGPFSHVLEYYDPFQSWLESGFMADGIERFMRYFPRENFLFLTVDEIATQPEAAWTKILGFAGLEPFQPEALHRKINVAGPKQSFRNRLGYRLGKILFGETIDQAGQTNPLLRALSGKDEYLEGMSPDLRARLQVISLPEILKIEAITGLDLGHWR
jgi:hypothetical protein